MSTFRNYRSFFGPNRRNYEVFGLEKRTQRTSISNNSYAYIDSNSILNFHIEKRSRKSKRDSAVSLSSLNPPWGRSPTIIDRSAQFYALYSYAISRNAGHFRVVRVDFSTVTKCSFTKRLMKSIFTRF